MSDPHDKRRRCLICKKRPLQGLHMLCPEHKCDHWICVNCYGEAAGFWDSGAEKMCMKDKVICFRLSAQ